MSTAISTEKYYDHLAKSYEQISERRSRFNLAIDDEILSLNRNKKIETMLDVGSGNGLRAKKIGQVLEVKRLYLSDVSNKMLKLCRKNVPEAMAVDLKVKTLESISVKFDIITIQWNVLGHVGSFEDKINLLESCRQCLASGGQIFLDVNNRHNITYGKLRVLVRYFVDIVWPKYERGDTMLTVRGRDKIITGSGHLFTVNEIKDLAKRSGLKISKLAFFDYESGKIRKYFFQGQIFCILELGK